MPNIRVHTYNFLPAQNVTCQLEQKVIITAGEAFGLDSVSFTNPLLSDYLGCGLDQSGIRE